LVAQPVLRGMALSGCDLPSQPTRNKRISSMAEVHMRVYRESNRRCAALLRSVRVDCRVIRNLQVTMNFEGAHECSVCMSEIIKLATNAINPLDPVKKIIA